MLEPDSRYGSLETATHRLPDGRAVTYLRRRFLPRGEELRMLSEVLTSEGERLDVIASRALGDPELFWRICDANDAMNPFELVAEPGRVLRIALPAPRGGEG